MKGRTETGTSGTWEGGALSITKGVDHSDQDERPGKGQRKGNKLCCESLWSLRKSPIHRATTGSSGREGFIVRQWGKRKRRGRREKKHLSSGDLVLEPPGESIGGGRGGGGRRGRKVKEGGESR